VSWEVVYTKQAQKNAKKLNQSGLKSKAQKRLEVIKENFLKNPPPYEILVGDLTGTYSRRINIQHRLVFQVYGKEKIAKIIRMWTHYE